MPRPVIHTEASILDGARAVVLAEGANAATIEAIARASRAPAGSIYHRFGSRDVVVVELWVRAVRRSQARFMEAVERTADPVEAVVAGGLSILDFAVEERDDARLLTSLRQEDLLRSPLPAPVARRIRDLNRPIGRTAVRLAEELYGAADLDARERVVLAGFDIPYGAIRRHLIADAAPPPDLKAPVERAVRAVLAVPPTRRSRSS